MKLQDQVCTLEQAKRLKELGVEQTGYFMWQETGHPDPTMPQETIGRYDREAYDNIGIASAFTVAELGVMLSASGYKWEGGLPSVGTEAQARAAMLIYLLENKLTTAEECNKRLNTVK